MMRIVADRDGGQECLKVTFVDHAMPGERVARSRGITMSVNADLARSLDGKRLEVTWTKR